MQPENFEKDLLLKTERLKTYWNAVLPARVGNISLRFINGNFRAQGWQGSGFQRWKANRRNGTILVQSGALRAASYFTSQPGQITLKNTMPYARMHNEGFEGVVRIPEHKRRLLAKTEVGTGKFTKRGKERMKNVTKVVGETTVKAHDRFVKIPRRQFMPTSATDSPVLANAFAREINRELHKIFD